MGENGKFTVDKSGRHHLNQVIRVNITSTEQTHIIWVQIRQTNKGYHIDSAVFLIKMDNLNLVIRKYHTNSY